MKKTLLFGRDGRAPAECMRAAWREISARIGMMPSLESERVESWRNGDAQVEGRTQQIGASAAAARFAIGSGICPPKAATPIWGQYP